METNELQILSLKELEEKCVILENEFNKKREILKQTYDEMQEMAKEYDEIQTIINKRQGKNAKTGK